MFRKLHFSYWLVIIAMNCSAQGKVTLASLLHELTDPASVATLPAHKFVLKQVSSYDRHSISPDQPGWFANDDHTHFYGVDEIDGRKEYIMMDEDGPGVIVRFWETTFKRKGTLRIYFDHEKMPRIIVPAYDLMKFLYPAGPALLAPHSSYEPVQKGGSTLYLPLPFNKHCKVTWEDAEEKKEPRYYQINFRKYAPGTTVETFSTASFNKNRQLLEKANELLLHPATVPEKKAMVFNKKIAGKEEISFSLPEGAAAVDYLELKLDDPKAYTTENLRAIYIKATFDGGTTVYCPVSDFFGSGAGNGAVASWYRTVEPGKKMISRWVMPYKKEGRISLVNTGDTTIGVSMIISTRKWSWNNRSLYFHANWKWGKDIPIRRTEADGPVEWDLLAIKGEGVFVGETLSVNNHMHKWYGEGDQKLWVDGEKFPSEYGTGLEDYYNTSWAPVVLYQTPFANATRADNADSFGENTFTRTRNLDGVPFTKHFRFSVEMLGWENGSADVGVVGYWYGRLGAKVE